MKTLGPPWPGVDRRSYATVPAAVPAFLQSFNHQRFQVPKLGGGFKYFLFSPLLGEMVQFDYIIFFGMG